MAPSRPLTWTAVALAVWLYRSNPVLRNCILHKAPLPVGYVANGDYATDCTSLGPVVSPSDDPLAGLAYCEDAILWDHTTASGKPSTPLLILSCDPNRAKVGTPERIDLAGYPEGHDFHPLGLDIWPSHEGENSNLYVVNHARARTVIEQFTMNPANPTQATYVRTISSPYFVAPNALALTSPDSFYVSNDHLITRRWPIIGSVVPILESIFGLPLSYVSHIQLNDQRSPAKAIKKHEFAVNFIPFANGVALSSDGKKFAVSSTSLAQVWFYDRDPATNALKATHTVPLPFTPDNIRFTHSPNGGEEELVVAGHPHFPSITKVAKNVTDAESGSWVVSIIPRAAEALGTIKQKFDLEAPVSTSDYVAEGSAWTLKTLFQSDGSAKGFVTSTTGLVDPSTGNLYVTGLYHPEGAIECRPRK
ncbi:arylesterase [Coprinopsis sp. MPI-PUGE-AT-0042]|nr:arylesterase [Coprinopsis sp. MPI-PUGE-AT-0042]